MHRREEVDDSHGGDLLPVGEIGRPHGIAGEVKVFLYSGKPEGFNLYTHVIIRHPDWVTEEPFVLESCRSQGQFAVVKFGGIDNRNAAGLLTGGEVFVERREMPELTEDEFYWHDLQGMTVFTLSGRRLGTVIRLLATGAHDILIVADQGQEYLLPAVDEFMSVIDWESRTIIVDPPEGLLEMND